MPAVKYTAYSAAGKKLVSGHGKSLKRPAVAPAYTSGGSTHRVKVGKAAGYHPHSRRAEQQPRWSNKRGLGRLSALHAHVLPKPYASVLSIQHNNLSVLVIHRHCVYTCIHDQAAVCAGLMKRGRKGSSQIAIDTYTPRSWKDRNPITSHCSTLMVESMACIDCSTTL